MYTNGTGQGFFDCYVLELVWFYQNNNKDYKQKTAGAACTKAGLVVYFT